MTTLSATPATAWNVVAAAKPGDIVQLAAGAYGFLGLWNLTKAAPGVTVMPLPGAAVSVTGIGVNGSTGLTLRGFDIQMTPATQYGVEIGGAKNITLDGVKVHQASSAALQGVGAFLRNASVVTIRNSAFYWLGVGVTAMDSDQVTLSANQIHDVNVDAIDLCGTSNSTISGNAIHDLRPGAGDHPDAIQLWATADHPSPSGNVISGNTYDRGSGDATTAAQGIFIEDQSNIVIRDNVLRGTMYNGIGLARCHKAEISGNFVQGDLDMAARIIVRGASTDVTIHENAANVILDYAADGANLNLKVANSTTIPQAPGSDITALTAWVTTRGSPVALPPITPPTGPSDPRDARITELTQELAAANAALAAAQTRGNGLANVLAQVGKLVASFPA